MKKLEDLKQIVAHSLTMSMTADRMGKALGFMPDDKCLEYLEKQQKTFPKVKLDKPYSLNTEVTLCLMTDLAYTNPVALEDVDEYLESLRDSIVELGDSFDTKALPLVVAYVLACYTVCATLDEETHSSLLDSTLSCFNVSKKDYDLATFFFEVCRVLALNGYFGQHVLKHCLDKGLVPSSTVKLVRTLMRYHLDNMFLSDFQNYAEDTVQGNYCETLMCAAMFFMCRVDTAYVNKGYKSSPRAQWSELFAIEGIAKEDLAFVYSAICTLSEHNHPLLKKELRSATLKEFINHDINNMVATF